MLNQARKAFWYANWKMHLDVGVFPCLVLSGDDQQLVNVDVLMTLGLMPPGHDQRPVIAVSPVGTFLPSAVFPSL